MSDHELDYTKTPCRKCGEIPTKLGMMVACDNCDEWFDYACAGVNNTVKEFDWFCEEAACQEAAEQSTNRWQRLSAEDEKILEEEQRRLEEEIRRSEQMEMRRMHLQAAMKKKKVLQNQRLQQKQQQLDEDFLKLELAEREREHQERLKAQKEHQLKLQEQERSFREQMAALDERPANAKGTAQGAEMGGTSAERKLCRPIKGAKHSSSQLSYTEKKTVEEDNSSSESEESSSSSKDSDEESEPDDSTKKNPSGTSKSRSGPTRAQLAARHSIGMSLPNFSGKVEEWPLFYAAYNSSTEACGFSDVENLARLNLHLLPPAKDLVMGPLTIHNPHLVSRIIEKLRKTYGRPAKLLEKLMDRVKETPPPKELKDFIPFANAVEQLCDHLEAADMKEHLRNPLLIKDLVKKLPDIEKRQWVGVKRTKKKREITLRTLSDFLVAIADDAQEAEVDIEVTESKAPVGQFSNEKSKHSGRVFHHSEPDKRTGRNPKPCIVCQGIGHPLRFCQELKELPLTERAELVTRERLCVVCLNGHGGQCRMNIRCDVGDCREAHNPLLHPTGGDAIGLNAHIRTDSDTLYRMVPVELHSRGRIITALAFLDEGSDVTLIEEDLANRLRLEGPKERLKLQWTDGVYREEEESRRVNVLASAVGAGVGEKTLLHSAHTIKRLKLPRQRLDREEAARKFKHLRGLQIRSYDGHPEVLIGLKNIHAFSPTEVKQDYTTHAPIAVRCKLGWTVYGSTPRSKTTSGCSHVGFHHAVVESQSTSSYHPPRTQRSRAAMDTPMKSATTTPKGSMGGGQTEEQLQRVATGATQTAAKDEGRADVGDTTVGKWTAQDDENEQQQPRKSAAKRRKEKKRYTMFVDVTPHEPVKKVTKTEESTADGAGRRRGSEVMSKSGDSAERQMLRAGVCYRGESGDLSPPWVHGIRPRARTPLVAPRPTSPCLEDRRPDDRRHREIENKR